MNAVLVHDCENPLATTGCFRVGMAQTLEDVIDCQRLRYLVFNWELEEWLERHERHRTPPKCKRSSCKSPPLRSGTLDDRHLFVI